MKRKSGGGFVNHTVQLQMAALAIWVTISIPSGLGYVREKKTHACAVRLDAALAGGAEKTCALTGKEFTTDEKGRLCDPDSEATHRVSSLCATPEAPAAVAHPFPGMTKPVLIVGISFVILIGGARLLL